MTTDGGTRRAEWFDTFRRRFTAFELMILIIGAVLGLAGNALYSDRYLDAVGLFSIGLLSGASVIAIDRLRAAAQGEVAKVNAELQAELQKHLNQVHVAVSFVPDQSSRNGGVVGRQPGYDAATKAVRRAEFSILVIGDYSPPPNAGATFDTSPPAHRSEYLEAIEDMLRTRVSNDDPTLPVLQYKRFIQRPVSVYEAARSRGSVRGGISLLSADMVGDEQAFEHCRTVLEIARAASAAGSRRIEVDIRIIPFLPNCPSILVVNERDMQFTIPTRADDPNEDDFARQGLMGILSVEDKARGSQVVNHFMGLFSRLKRFSTAVIGTEPGPPGQQ